MKPNANPLDPPLDCGGTILWAFGLGWGWGVGGGGGGCLYLRPADLPVP